MLLKKSFLLLLPLAILLYYEGAGAGSSSCWKQDREALVDLQTAVVSRRQLFYTSLDNQNQCAAPWFQWDSDQVADCCQWQGVSCDRHSGRVIELQLPATCSYGVCSALPSTLSQLEALQVLNLRGGCFSGDIPPHTFATLTNLTHLDLSHNHFYPAQLPLLPKLTYFNFSCNFLHVLDGRPGFNFSSLARSLPHLRYLDLSLSEFWGDPNNVTQDSTFSEWSANFLPHLIHLDISGNSLSGIIPEQLGTLQSLQYLNLAGNNFRNPVPWPSLANLSQLKVLKLGNFEGESLVWEERRTQWPCKWRALESLSCDNMRFASDDSTPFCLEQPGIISKLRYLSFTSPIGSIAPLLRSLSAANTSLSLQSLLLTKTSLEDFQPPHLPAWLRPLHTPVLESLDVSQNALTSFPAWLNPQIPLLQSLDISQNKLAQFPSTLRHSRFLQSLDISDNQLNVSLTQLELHTSARLQSLRLSQNAITGTIPQSLLMLSLSVLDLSHNHLAGGIPFSIGNLSSLTDLYLAGNNFTGAIPPSIGMLKALSFLDLSDNMLFGELPQSMGNLTALTWLSLSRNAITGTIPRSLLMLSLSALDLSHNQLAGRVPFSIWNMSSLTHLCLSGNNFTGAIPPSIGMWKALSFLDLSDNMFGEIPQSMGNLTALTWLSLSRNAITGTVPRSLLMLSLSALDLSHNQLAGGIPFSIWNMSSLTQLYLSGNNFTGAIPPSIGMSKALSFLDLSDNMLFGEIPQSMGNLTALTWLSLSRNAITETVPRSLLMLSLSTLDLSHNQLAGGIPFSIGNLSLLGQLDLSENNILGAIPPSIGLSKALYSLNLSDNMLFGEIPQSMGNLTALSMLDVSHNNLLGAIPASIFQLLQLSLDLSFNNLQLPSSVQSCALRSLDLSNNFLSGRVPHIFFDNCSVLVLANNNLSGALPRTYQNCSLQGLDLSRNKLTGEIPEAMFQNCQALSFVNLGQNFLSFKLPASVAKLSELWVLVLYQNELSGAIPSALRNCSQLMVLDLSHNHLGGGIPQWITGTNFPGLVVLMLSNNKLQGSIPLSLVESFTHLQIIGLANNILLGSIPLHLSHLVAMSQSGVVSATEFLYSFTLNIPNKGIDQALKNYILSATVALDLSGNHLEGPIPAQIGTLKGLTLLNLSRNTLTGPIPSTLGGLSASLESLDLSNNQLEGGIPSELCSLDGLGYLNLSSNHLQGPIPACRRLSNFDKSCFEHNPELCGSPLLEQCAMDEAPAVAAQVQEESGHQRTWFEKLQEEVELSGVGVGYAAGLLVTGWILNRRLLR